MIGIYDEQIYEYLDGLFRIKDFQFTFKQEIQVEIDFGSPITFWKSPTHKLESTNAKNNAKVNNQHLVLLLEDIPNNYDPNEINLPRAILSHTKNDALQYQKYCATLTFIPKFNEVSLDDAYSQYLDGLIIADNQKLKEWIHEWIKNQKAKEALILFLKSLPQDSEYNIISFGTNFTKLWNVSQNYSQNTLETAIKHVEEMDADMGGTCIIAPLKQMIYHKNYGASKNTTLNVFLLTDGQDTADPIIDLVQKNNLAQTRIYTLGIGRECSQYLIRRVAEVGNGKYQIVSDKEDINEKVIDLLEDSLTPYLEAFTLESNIPNITSIIPNPDSIVSLKNQELTFQILFPNQQKPEVLEFKIRCYDPQNNQQISYSVKLNLNESQDNEYFHKLAAYKFITYYENSIKYGQNNVNFIKLNKNKIDSQDIIALSVQNQILCSRTAFICEVCDLEDQFQQQIKQRVSVVQPKQARQPAQLYACSGYQSRCNIQLQQASSQYKSSGCCSTGGSSKSYSNFNTSPSPQKYALQTQPLKNKSDSDKFTYETLIQFAQANGCFIINKEVKSKINFKNLQNHQNLKDDVWFTFLVLLYLENYFSQYKNHGNWFIKREYHIQNRMEWIIKQRRMNINYDKLQIIFI